MLNLAKYAAAAALAVGMGVAATEPASASGYGYYDYGYRPDRALQQLRARCGHSQPLNRSTSRSSGQPSYAVSKDVRYGKQRAVRRPPPAGRIAS
jgi:hypothetical protein